MEQHVVVYRIGGTQNFKWRSVFELFNSMDEMENCQAKLMLSGYVNRAITKVEFDEKNVPNTWEGKWK